MPDVAVKCPDCGTVLQYPGTDKWMPIEQGTTAHTRERCLEAQRDAARAEAERWKRRHDALRAAVIKADALIVDAIHRATAMYNHTQDADYESHSDGLDEALMILRQLLAEAGGVE